MNSQLGFTETINAALGFQRQLWDTWASTVGAKAPSKPWDEGVERSLGMSEELVNHCFKLQADCVKAMNPATPPLMRRSASTINSSKSSWMGSSTRKRAAFRSGSR